MGLNIPAGQVAQGLLSLSGNIGGRRADRVPMVFGSTLRDLVSSNDNSLLDQLTDEAANYVGRPGVLTQVVMAVNPNSIEWDLPKRINELKVSDGSVFQHFVNSRGQDNDILRLRFSGNTGNLDSREDLDPALGAKVGGLNKLRIWQNLYLMTREPRIIGPGIENEFFIRYQTPLFPQPLTFVGFFAATLRFRETAVKSNSRDYDFEFVVTRTEPDLDDYVFELIEFVDAALQGTTQTGVTEEAAAEPAPPTEEVT